MNKIIIFLLLLSSIVRADDTGWLSPSATGEDYTAWSTPSNAYSSNDTYAYTYGAGNMQDYYNFGVPEIGNEYVIDSVLIGLEGVIGASANDVIEVEISTNGGTTYTTANYQNTFTNFVTDVTKIYGRNSGLWGKSWVSSDFTNANLRIRIEFVSGGQIFYLDQVQLRVYYSLSYLGRKAYGFGKTTPVKAYGFGKTTQLGAYPFNSQGGGGEEEQDTSQYRWLYYDDFESYTLLSPLPAAIKDSMNLNTGKWDDNYVIIGQNGSDKCLDVTLTADFNNTPITNTYLCQDSLYNWLCYYYEYIWVTPDITNGTGGGKMFFTGAGNGMFSDPFGLPESSCLGDTNTCSHNALFTYDCPTQSINFYCRTKNATFSGLYPSQTVGRPSENADFANWPGSTNPTGYTLGDLYEWHPASEPFDGDYFGETWGRPTDTEWRDGQWNWGTRNPVPLITNQIATIVIYVKINDYNTKNGSVAVFLNGVCKYTRSDIYWATKERYYFDKLANGYINVFSGGGSSSHPNDFDENVKILKYGSFYYKHNHPSYKANGYDLNDVISIPPFTGHKYPGVAASKPLSKTYTDQNGVIYSHNKYAKIIPMRSKASSLIEPTGATSITVTIDSMQIRETTTSNADSLRIFAWESNAWVLKARRGGGDGDDTGTVGTYSSPVLIQWNSGLAWECPSAPIWWKISYTSNGTTSGNNFTYPNYIQITANQYKP